MKNNQKSIKTKKCVFFSWVGFKDLNYVDSMIDDATFTESLDKAKASRPGVSLKSNYSPVVTAVKELKKNKALSDVILFYDLEDDAMGERFRRFVSTCVSDIEVKIKHIKADNVHAKHCLYTPVREAWLEEAKDLKDIKACFNLSSGTTAMKVMLAMLGKTKCQDAEFVEISSDGKNVEISPFDFDFNSMALESVFDNPDLTAFKSIIGDSPAIQRAKLFAAKAGRTDFNVLIFGESGTGKELFAKAIHDSSCRKNNKFMAVNCAALPPQLIESMLFGYKKGAFTGANADTAGMFKSCDKGTLFLDEVEALPQEVQAKLLRVLQPEAGKNVTLRKYLPVGGTDEETSDVRIIAATNQKLEAIGFRSDLLNRLAVLSLSLPPLRERGKDIVLLAESLLKDMKKQLQGEFKNKKFSESAIKFIEHAPWPGNVRQLQNALAQAMVFGEGNEIKEEDFFNFVSEKNEDIGMSSVSDCKEEVPSNIQEYLKKKENECKVHFMKLALEKGGGVKSKAANLLGISYQTWDNWKKELSKDGVFVD